MYLLEGGKEGIINPMVFNMAPAYENAKYPNIWISTSRIKGKVIFTPLPGNIKQIILEIMHLTMLTHYFHDLFFFSPFSTASSDIILDLACKLKKPNVGLVHQMPFVTDQKGFAATLEKVSTCTFWIE